MKKCKLMGFNIIIPDIQNTSEINQDGAVGKLCVYLLSQPHQNYH